MDKFWSTRSRLVYSNRVQEKQSRRYGGRELLMWMHSFTPPIPSWKNDTMLKLNYNSELVGDTLQVVPMAIIVASLYDDVAISIAQWE